MTFEEIKGQSLDELKATEEKLRKTLTDSRIQLRMGRLASTTKVIELRKDVARVLTAIQQKQATKEKQKKQ